MLQLNRTISFTKSWKATFTIALIIAATLSFILVFLQPFDTYYSEIENKNIKLVGYSLPIIITVPILHLIEKIWYKQTKKWMLYQEFLILLLGFIFITFLSFLYLNTIVNPTKVPFNQFFNWLIDFSLPFAPPIMAFWIYLRFRFSKIEFFKDVENEIQDIQIEGSNKGELIQFKWQEFYYANAQSNYVDIYLNDNSNTLKKIVIRSSFSNFIEQIPRAIQVHRSYAINVDYIKSIEGNSRQGFCTLKNNSNKIPVSPKHFKALKLMLQNRP